MDIVKAYRSVNRKSRIIDTIKVRKNSNSSRDYQCILCGEIFGSYCPKWPRTKQSYSEVKAHRENCSELPRIIAAAVVSWWVGRMAALDMEESRVAA